MGVAALVSRGLRADQMQGNIRAPADWLFKALGAEPADTGESVSRDRALTVSGFWRGMNLLSFGVAKVPLLVMKRTADEGKERATRHASYRILRRQFNPYMTAFQGKLVVTYHRMMHGNGYCIIIRDPDTSLPRELIVADPTSTWPVRVNGRLWYIIEIPTEVDEDGYVRKSEIRKLEATDVLHIRGLGFDGLVGYDVLTYARESLGMSLATRKFGAKFFANNAQPSLVLEAPGELRKEVRETLLAKWNQIRKGIEKSHKTALLTHGITAKPISSTARESQLVELRKFEVREIANFLGVPPHMLGDDSKSSYNSLEMEGKRFLDDALDPLLCTWEDEAAAKLLTERQKERETHTVEAVREAVVSIDFKTRISGVVEQVNNGLLSDNEGRRLLNLAGKGPEGDRFRIPANIRYADEEDPNEPEEAPDTPDPEEPDDELEEDDQVERMRAGARACLEDAARRMATRLGGIARKAAKSPRGYVGACEQLAGERVAIAKVLAPSISAVRGVAGTTADAESLAAADWLITRATEIFLEAGQCAADELATSVAKASREAEDSLPEALSKHIEHGA